jgi:hypothetical protein
MADNVILSLGVLAATVVLFLLLRAIVLWYWRITEGIALLKSIDEKLGRLTAAAPMKPSERAEPNIG